MTKLSAVKQIVVGGCKVFLKSCSESQGFPGLCLLGLYCAGENVWLGEQCPDSGHEKCQKRISFAVGKDDIFQSGSRALPDKETPDLSASFLT